MAGNIFEDSGSADSGSQNIFESATGAAAKSSNVFEDAASTVKGGGAKVMHVVGDALDWQRAKSQDAIFHGGSSDENRKRLRQSLGIEGAYEGAQTANTPEWAAHLLRGATDTVLDTATDPLTYETMGGSVLRKGAVGALGLLGRGVDAATKAPIIGERVGAARDAAGVARDWGRENFTHGGKAAIVHGRAAVEDAMGMKSKYGVAAERRSNGLTQQLKDARGNLNDDEWTDALHVHSGTKAAGDVSSRSATAASGLNDLTEDLRTLHGDAATRTQALPGFETPHVPNLHAKERTFNELDPTHARPIEVNPEDHAATHEAFLGAIKGAARAEQLPNLVAELKARFKPGEMPGDVAKYVEGHDKPFDVNQDAPIPDEIRDLFSGKSKATGDERSAGNKMSDLAKIVVAMPKAAIVGMSPRHIFNIANLLSARSLRAIPEAAITAAKLMRHPEQRYELLKEGIEHGAIGPMSPEKEMPLAELLKRAPGFLAPVGKLGAGIMGK